jgi:hypothetical protein
MNTNNTAVQFLEIIVRELDTNYRLDRVRLSDLSIYLVDLSPLRLRLPPDTPCIVISAMDIEHFGQKGIFELVTQEINVRQTFPGSVIVLVETDSDFLDELKGDPFWAIVLYSNDIRKICSHPNPKRALQDLFRIRVPLRFLSPYEPNEAVVGSQFYGRTTELNLVLTHRKNSFAIYGGRKIGKTSLLKEVKRTLVDHYIEKEHLDRIFWYDFWGYPGEEVFFEAVVRHFGEGFPKLVRPDFSSYFPRFIERMKAVHGGPIIFFLDEVDDLILHERGHNYHLLGLLKRISAAGNARFLMAGFRFLAEEINRHNTPLNFMRPLPLSNLTREQTFSMLREPMISMGIELEKNVPPQILQDTGGHPHLVQLFGQAIIEMLDESNDRIVNVGLVRKIKQTGRVYDALVHTLIDNTTDLEFALVCGLAEREEFDLDVIDAILDAHGIQLEVKQIQQVCRSLEASGIINRRGLTENFQFSVPLQPALAKRVASDDFIWRKAIQSANRHPIYQL